MNHIALIFVGVLTTATFHPSTGYTCDVPKEWLEEHGRNFYPGNLWYEGVVKYEFNSSLTLEDISEVRKAFDEYHTRTCIRFVARSPGETPYVSIENDPTTCGVAHLCRGSGYQYAKFGGTCRTAQVMTHELGHTLCYGHEQSRKDRDEYINFPGCQPSEIPGKNENYDLMGTMYDYASQMHYSCQRCSAGWPTMPGDISCGNHVSPGLSVLDVEKINALYECTGCLSYRFKNFATLTPEQEEDLFPGGDNPTTGPTYICRSYHMGDIIPGVYDLNSGFCTVGYNNQTFQYEAGDVLTNPSGANLTWVQSSGTIPTNAIAGGRNSRGSSFYMGRASVTLDGVQHTVIGKVEELSPRYLNFPLNGREYSETNFQFLICNN